MTSKKPSILLVEDNKLVRKISIILLEHLQCEVDAVTTGSLALEHAEKIRYDLIFMDIGLPDVDGLSVIRHIRAHSKLNKGVPIITLTANSDKLYIQESFDVGATDFLVKPLNDYMSRLILQKYATDYEVVI